MEETVKHVPCGEKYDELWAQQANICKWNCRIKEFGWLERNEGML